MILLALLAQLAMPPSYTPALRTPDLTCREKGADWTYIRSRARRTLFLKMIGVKTPSKVPTGMIVNHIVPLACGGCDLPSNMELMSVAEWKGRTGPERYDCGRHPGGEWTWP